MRLVQSRLIQCKRNVAGSGMSCAADWHCLIVPQWSREWHRRSSASWGLQLPLSALTVWWRAPEKIGVGEGAPGGGGPAGAAHQPCAQGGQCRDSVCPFLLLKASLLQITYTELAHQTNDSN